MSEIEKKIIAKLQELVDELDGRVDHQMSDIPYTTYAIKDGEKIWAITLQEDVDKYTEELFDEK